MRRARGLALALLLGMGAHARGAAVPAEPAAVTVAQAALVAYDSAVRQFKLSHGHNVTLQLDDPCPQLLSSPAARPLSAALDQLATLLDAEASHPRARPVQAAILMRLGRNSDAIACLHEQVRRYPDDAPAWNLLGIALARRGAAGDLERRLDCYRRAAALAPGDATAWANLCNALGAAGRNEGALEAGRRAVALRPSYVYAWMNLGVSFGELGREAEEESAYLAAIRVPPSEERCPFARFNLALLYERQGRLAQAATWYRDALRVGLPQGPASKQAASFHYNLARALYRQGTFADSAFEAAEAARLAPEMPEAASLLGHLFARAGDLDASRRMFERATALLEKHGPSRPEQLARHAE